MTRTATILGVVALLSGCNPSMPWEDIVWSTNYGETTDLQNARINAEVGRFSAIDDAGWGSLHQWDYGFTVDVRGQTNGIVMAWLDIQNVELDALQAGDTFTGNTDYYGDSDEPWIYMLGCAGDTEDYWEEDYPAEDVQVEVTDVTTDGITVDFTGRLEYTGQVVSGTATIPVAGG